MSPRAPLLAVLVAVMTATAATAATAAQAAQAAPPATAAPLAAAATAEELDPLAGAPDPPKPSGSIPDATSAPPARPTAILANLGNAWYGLYELEGDHALTRTLFATASAQLLKGTDLYDGGTPRSSGFGGALGVVWFPSRPHGGLYFQPRIGVHRTRTESYTVNCFHDAPCTSTQVINTTVRPFFLVSVGYQMDFGGVVLRTGIGYLVQGPVASPNYGDVYPSIVTDIALGYAF